MSTTPPTPGVHVAHQRLRGGPVELGREAPRSAGWFATPPAALRQDAEERVHGLVAREPALVKSTVLRPGQAVEAEQSTLHLDRKPVRSIRSSTGPNAKDKRGAGGPHLVDALQLGGLNADGVHDAIHIDVRREEAQLDRVLSLSQRNSLNAAHAPLIPGVRAALRQYDRPDALAVDEQSADGASTAGLHRAAAVRVAKGDGVAAIGGHLAGER